MGEHGGSREVAPATRIALAVSDALFSCGAIAIISACLLSMFASHGIPSFRARDALGCMGPWLPSGCGGGGLLYLLALSIFWSMERPRAWMRRVICGEVAGALLPLALAAVPVLLCALCAGEEGLAIAPGIFHARAACSYLLWGLMLPVLLRLHSCACRLGARGTAIAACGAALTLALLMLDGALWAWSVTAMLGASAGCRLSPSREGASPPDPASVRGFPRMGGLSLVGGMMLLLGAATAHCAGDVATGNVMVGDGITPEAYLALYSSLVCASCCTAPRLLVSAPVRPRRIARWARIAVASLAFVAALALFRLDAPLRWLAVSCLPLAVGLLLVLLGRGGLDKAMAGADETLPLVLAFAVLIPGNVVSSAFTLSAPHGLPLAWLMLSCAALTGCSLAIRRATGDGERAGESSLGRRLEPYGLSSRELAIAKGMVRGWSLARIAEEEGVARATAGTYAQRLYRKLGVSSKAEALAVLASDGSAREGNGGARGRGRMAAGLVRRAARLRVDDSWRSVLASVACAGEVALVSVMGASAAPAFDSWAHRFPLVLPRSYDAPVPLLLLLLAVVLGALLSAPFGRGGGVARWKELASCSALLLAVLALETWLPVSRSLPGVPLLSACLWFSGIAVGCLHALLLLDAVARGGVLPHAGVVLATPVVLFAAPGGLPPWWAVAVCALTSACALVALVPLVETGESADAAAPSGPSVGAPAPRPPFGASFALAPVQAIGLFLLGAGAAMLASGVSIDPLRQTVRLPLGLSADALVATAFLASLVLLPAVHAGMRMAAASGASALRMACPSVIVALLGGVSEPYLGGVEATLEGSFGFPALGAAFLLVGLAALAGVLADYRLRLVAASMGPAGLCGRLVDGYGLTQAEGRVAVCLAMGKSASEIAAEQVVSTATVRTHRKRIYAKMGVHSQQELREHVAYLRR